MVFARRALCLVLLLSLLAGAHAPTAHADAQVSLRHALGAGKRWADIADDVIFETALLRGEALFGKPEPESWRIGPAFELRTVDFESVEGAAGASLSIPLPGDFPIGLTGLLGYAGRRRAPDGAVGIGTLSWGYRGYNYHHWYGWGLGVYASARRSLTGSDVTEITGGVELDVMFTTIIPILAIRNFFRGGDPHEP